MTESTVNRVGRRRNFRRPTFGVALLLGLVLGVMIVSLASSPELELVFAGYTALAVALVGLVAPRRSA